MRSKNALSEGALMVAEKLIKMAPRRRNPRIRYSSVAERKRCAKLREKDREAFQAEVATDLEEGALIAAQALVDAEEIGCPLDP